MARFSTLRERLATLNRPIQVGIVGVGAMGKGLFYQCQVTPGMSCVAVADLNLEAAESAVAQMGGVHQRVSSVTEAEDAIRRGRVAVCADGDIVAALDSIDALIESTSAIEAASRFAVTALENRKHLVLMNAEIDLIFGPALMRRARRNGVVYTSCDGDQHGVIKRIWDEMQLWDITPFLAGNIKGFLDRYANPTTIIPEADKRNLDYRMCASYTDGTKLNVEMALCANALGLSTDVPGMHGPRAAHAREALDLFDLRRMWESGTGVVDYVLGAEPGGGVFVVGHCDHPYQRDMLKYYKLGDGPFYVMYRPYHLCHVEAMRGVAEAVLDGVSLLEPTAGFRTNVFSYAKTDLRAGDELDGIGGYRCYGLIENCDPKSKPAGLPICLAEHVTLKRDIAKDSPITLADVKLDPNRGDYMLYEECYPMRQEAA